MVEDLKKLLQFHQQKKKITTSKVKESSSNIESSSSIDLSAEQKKMSSSSSGRRRTAEIKDIQGQGPDSQRISQEVEEFIKRRIHIDTIYEVKDGVIILKE